MRAWGVDYEKFLGADVIFAGEGYESPEMTEGQCAQGACMGSA
jgi:hypothetical protein